MSPVILKASFGTPVDLGELPADQRAQVRVEPGEVVFVRTIEKLNLPNNVIAVLSPKRKLSHQGIIVLGGFAIDPKYRGPLFIGLYNFSSTPFNLQAGRKLIAAMFYELAEAEVTEFPVPEPMGEEEEFPDELVTLIKNYKPVELKWVTDALTETQRRLDALSSEVHSDQTWKREFQEALDRQTSQIDKLLEGLKEEKEARKDEDKAIRTKLEGMSNFFTSAKLIWVIGYTAVALLLGGTVGTYVWSRVVASLTPVQVAPAPVAPVPPAPPKQP